ncbi:MAG: PIN domain-containing protein [Candidatus Bathyarchaeia archaeon]
MILLDSSLIIAYSNEADQNHVKALKIVEDVDKGEYGTPAITDYIFDEAVTVMLVKTKSPRLVADLGEKLSRACLLFRVDEQLFNASWKLFKEQVKPMFSFTDFTTISVCKANRIPNIATFDEDFLKLKEFKIVGVQRDQQ